MPFAAHSRASDRLLPGQIMRLVLITALALLAAACASPVGVTRVETQESYRIHSVNALSAGRPSDASQTVLRRFGLLDRFTDEPGGVLGQLHAGLAPSGSEDRLFALAELSFLEGLRTRDRGRFLAAAIYAYALLFPGSGAAVPFHTSDPRLRLTYEIYNAGLAQGLADQSADEPKSAGWQYLRLEGGERALPFGTLELAAPPVVKWAGYRLERFVPTTALETRGLRNRYYQRGLGVSVAASLAADRATGQVPGAHRIGPRTRVPMTAVMRLERVRESLAAGRVRGQLEVYSAHEARSIDIDGSTQPLEADPSAALALQLEGSPLYDVEMAAFLRGNIFGRLVPKDRENDGLELLQPYRRGKMPVVLVHGTASSPARWAELVNELQGDPAIMARYQIWVFIYDSGNPIAYSAGRLRSALEATLQELDPQGVDRELRSMVVAGHSQGGLLTKLTVIDSGTKFWDMVSPRPFESVEISAETRALLQRSLFFRPLPFVKRVIFIATPHRGALMAQGRIGAIAARLVRFPSDLFGQIGQSASDGEDAALLAQLGRPANAVQNMNPGHRSIRMLATIPVAPYVPAHSIIAVKGTGPVQGGNDGVVAYESAHLPEAASELVIRHGHSVQGHPEAIEEVRRILFEHAAVHAELLQ